MYNIKKNPVMAAWNVYNKEINKNYMTKNLQYLKTKIMKIK